MPLMIIFKTNFDKIGLVNEEIRSDDSTMKHKSPTKALQSIKRIERNLLLKMIHSQQHNWIVEVELS